MGRGVLGVPAGSALRGLGFVAVLIAVPLLGAPQWILSMGVFTLMFATMASAWNLVGGFAGYPSLGHAAFFGIGAYTLALLFDGRTVNSGYEPFLVLPLVGLIAAAIGVPIAAVSMRTRADVFAIVTITFLFVVQTLAFNLTAVTGGSQGIALPIPPFDASRYERPFYYVLLVLLVLAMLATHATMRSKLGLSLACVRADEDKARGLGVRTTGVKVAAFTLSVALTAMVGGVWAYYQSFIYPQFAIDPLITISVVLMTFLGGRATLWGPVLGAFVLESGQQYLAYSLGASQFYLIAYALVFLLIMLFLPRGILPTISDRLRRGRLRRSRDAAPPQAQTAPPQAQGSAPGPTEAQAGARLPFGSLAGTDAGST